MARVRDLIVCATDASDKVPIEEVYKHPPIGEEHYPGLDDDLGEWVERVELGGGITVEELDQDLAELVMNACTPRGHYFVPVRQFGQRYSFVKEVPLEEWEERHFAWDTNGTLDDALTLSRLVRDNGYSTEYAARLIDYEDGQRCVVYVPYREDKTIYRLSRGREWLDAAEGRELAALLATYWECHEDLPPRVREAMWRMAFGPRIRWADMLIPILVSGLEALLKIGRRDLTEQFRRRVPALADDLDVDGMTEDLAEQLYEGRSIGFTVRTFSFSSGLVAPLRPRETTSRRDRRPRIGRAPSPRSRCFRMFSAARSAERSRTPSFVRSSSPTRPSRCAGPPNREIDQSFESRASRSTSATTSSIQRPLPLSLKRTS